MTNKQATDGHLGWVIGLTSTAYFMVVIDATVVVTALPRMQRDLHVGLASLQWTLAAYGIAFAAGIITVAELIAARTLQGLGAAAVLPLSLTILTTAFPPERRGMIVGVYGGLAGLAVALGPILGGAIAQAIDWHWIFWINVPIGVAAFIWWERRTAEPMVPLRLFARREFALGNLASFLLNGATFPAPSAEARQARCHDSGSSGPPGARSSSVE